MPECGAVWSGRALGRDSDARVGLKASKWIHSRRRTADELVLRAPNEGIDVRGSRGAFRPLFVLVQRPKRPKTNSRMSLGCPRHPSTIEVKGYSVFGPSKTAVRAPVPTPPLFCLLLSSHSLNRSWSTECSHSRRAGSTWPSNVCMLCRV